MTAPRSPVVITELPHASQSAHLSPERWAPPHDGDLSRAGYEVREYLVAGAARLYRGGSIRPPAVDRDAVEYITRALVIRPISGTNFSGRVHLELLNPSTGSDFPMYWPDAGAHLVRSGDAYIGVTCKAVSARALRSIRGGRYADLAVPHDGVVWDLLKDVASTARLPDGGGLLSGLGTVDRILATGWSQSGSFLRSYLSEGLHDAHSDELGRHVIDAYLIGVSSGGYGPMGYVPVDRDGEFVFDENLHPQGELVTLAMDDQRRTVRGSSVPVFEYMSEDEARQHPRYQRPDSDVTVDHYRCYQIPARGHETGLLPEAARRRDHDDLGQGSVEYPDPPLHRASVFLIAAAIENLFSWTDGIAPPRVDPIALIEEIVDRDGRGLDFSSTSILRDDLGHALGGLRYLEVELPVARMAPDVDGPSTIQLWSHTPLTPAELRERYGSVTELRERAEQVVDRLVTRGHYLATDTARAVDGYLEGLDF